MCTEESLSAANPSFGKLRHDTALSSDDARAGPVCLGRGFMNSYKETGLGSVILVQMLLARGTRGGFRFRSSVAAFKSNAPALVRLASSASANPGSEPFPKYIVSSTRTETHESLVAEVVREPSEVLQPFESTTPQKATELFPVVQDHRGQIQAGAGGALALAGISVLAWQHQALWCNLDFAGAALLLVGGAVAGTSSLARNASAAPPELSKRFKFKCLNDTYALQKDLQSLNSLSREPGLTSRLPQPARALLEKADLKERAESRQRKKERRAEISKQIEEDLAEGLPVYRVKQKLQPRAFLLDFDDGGGVRKPPGSSYTNTRKPVE